MKIPVLFPLVFFILGVFSLNSVFADNISCGKDQRSMTVYNGGGYDVSLVYVDNGSPITIPMFPTTQSRAFCSDKYSQINYHILFGKNGVLLGRRSYNLPISPPVVACNMWGTTFFPGIKCDQLVASF
jgi:hypothetical protein